MYEPAVMEWLMVKSSLSTYDGLVYLVGFYSSFNKVLACVSYALDMIYGTPFFLFLFGRLH
jgi:hypothetical protein